MGLFSFGKKRERTFLIVDIESGSVGAAAVTLPPAGGAHEKPRVLFTARERIAPAEHLDPAHFFAATSEVLKKLVAHLFRFYRNEAARAEELHIFLHAPWIVSKTRAVRKDFSRPTLLSEALLASVVQAAEQGIEENFRAAHREIAGSVRVVEKKITEFSLNGYTLMRPLGKEAKTLEMTLLESFAPEQAIVKFGDILSLCSSAPREWHGAAAACAGVLAQCAPDAYGDALLVLTEGSETTECAVVRDGVVREIASVPFGVRTAARAACETEAFHSVAAAETSLSAPASVGAAFTPAHRRRVEAARADATERFRRALSALIFPKLTGRFFPHEALLLAAEEHLLFFEEALREPLRGNAPRMQLLSVSVRDARAFAPLLQWARVAHHDTLLSAEAAFLSLYKNR